MKTLQLFEEIIGEQNLIALATCVENQPSVRVLNFVTSSEQPGLLYFATFKGSRKGKELEINNKTSFTTLPNNNAKHIRVDKALVVKSDLSIYDLQESFISQLPHYKERIDNAGQALEVYEVRFEQATVIVDNNSIYNLVL